jgi:hypothetical protein
MGKNIPSPSLIQDTPICSPIVQPVIIYTKWDKTIQNYDI